MTEDVACLVEFLPSKYEVLGLMDGWSTPIFLALGKGSQENPKFRVILDYVKGSRPAWDT